MFDQALCVVGLAGLDALREVVIADGGDDFLRVLLFIHHPACRLVLRLCVGLACEFGQHDRGFGNGGGIFEHAFDASAVVVDTTRHLAVGACCLSCCERCGR